MQFTDLLRQLNVPYRSEGHHHCRAGWVQLDCPWCGRNSSRFHLGYNIAGRYANCWRCGPHRLADILAEATGRPWKEFAPLVKDLERAKVSDVKPTGRLVLPKGLEPMGPAHQRYLRKRGYDPDQIAKLWGVQGIGIAAHLQWRLFLPIVLRGQAVSWTTRSLVDEGVRYISAGPEQEIYNHKHLLYGEDYVAHAVIVHEGPTDVWRTGPGAVCTFGTGFTRAQVLRLSRVPVRVICYDNEPLAQAQAKKLCDLLEPFPGQTYNVTLSAKDAGVATDLEIDQLRQEFLYAG